MTSIERQHQKLLKRLAELEQATLPVRVWIVKCGFMSTSVVVKIKASGQDEAIDKARKHKSGKGADVYTVVGVEDVRPSVSGPVWRRVIGA